MKPCLKIILAVSLIASAVTCLSITPAAAAAWSTTPGATWDGSSGTLSIPQHMTGPELNTVQQVAFQDGKPWDVSFEVRLGDNVGSMSVQLLEGGQKIGWMGADAYYKAESAFLGKDMPSTRPVDELWHQYEYRSDGQHILFFCDGNKVDEADTTSAPDTIKVVSYQMEVTIKNVNITTPSSPAQNTPVANAATTAHQSAIANSSRQDRVLFTYPATPARPAPVAQPVIVPYYVPYYIYSPPTYVRRYSETDIYTELGSW